MTTSPEIDESMVKCTFKGTIITYKRIRTSHAKIEYETVPEGLDKIAGKDIQELILGEARKRKTREGRSLLRET